MLSLFRWAALRQDFKEVLTDLFCVIAVGLADEPDGIRQQDVAFAFSALYFCHSSYSLFVICFILRVLRKCTITARVFAIQPYNPIIKLFI